MDGLIDTIHFQVECFDGQAEGDVGYPYYVAHSDELHATTDGQTFEELLANIREVMELVLELDVENGDYHLTKHPRVIITFEIAAYAETA